LHKRSIVRDSNSLRLRKYSHISAMILTAAAFLSLGRDAAALTADDVLNRMNAEQQASYIAGVVGGLAYSRFLRDRPDTVGMSCINDWYYGSGTDKWVQIETWFSRHLEQQVEPLLYVLIRRECGE